MFRTDSAPGIHPSEPSPLTRLPGVSDRRHPRTVWLWSNPATEAAGRPTERQPLGFDPCEDPLRAETCLAHRPPDAPLGLPLLGHATDDLVPTFAGTPLTHLLRIAPYGLYACVPQGLISRRLATSESRHEADVGCDSPSRVSAPVRFRPFGHDDPGAMGSPRVASCIAADRQRSFGIPRILPELPGNDLGAEPCDPHVAILFYKNAGFSARIKSPGVLSVRI